MPGWLDLQRLIVFPRYATAPRPHVASQVANLERLQLATPDGFVEAWWMSAGKDERRPAVVFAHGNAELIDYWPDTLEAYRKMGAHVLLPEFRGYGRSAGKPSQEAIVDDFVRFYDLIVNRPEVDSSRIVFHGRSLGGGVVCALAEKRLPQAMILQSTFTSIVDIAKNFFMPRYLVLDPFDNVAAVRNLDVPILIIHGTIDQVVPYAHGKTLAAEAKHAHLISYNANHNDCPPDWDAFWKEVRSFLEAQSVIMPATSDT